jgi:hypothetical protein
MTDFVRSFQGLIAGAGYLVALPLVLLSAALWTLLAERAAAMSFHPWKSLFPALRQRKEEVDDGFHHALDAYLNEPKSEHEIHLFERSGAAEGPEALLVHRSLLGGASMSGAAVPGFAISSAALPSALMSGDLRRLRLHGAYVLGCSEINAGVDLARCLARATLLWGVFAAVAGLERTFFSVSANGLHSELLWNESATSAVMGCQLALIAFLPGLLGVVWLTNQRAHWMRTIELRRASLAQALDRSLAPTEALARPKTAAPFEQDPYTEKRRW